MNSTFVHSLSNSIKSLPMREAVRYKHKNMKWTAYAFNVRLSYCFVLYIVNKLSKIKLTTTYCCFFRIM